MNGIVQILEDQRIAGTGFLVSTNGLIVTCAHVVGTSMPKKVMVVFQAEGKPREATVISEWWRGIDAEDVAFLRVNGGLPKGAVEPLPLGSSSGTEGLRIKTFGYPADNEVVGERGSGEVMGFGSFTATGQPILQLSYHE